MHCFVLLLLAAALAVPKDPAWEPFAYLVGEWIGEGAGQPGEASGGFRFRFDLDDKVLVRDNWADYPQTKDRPAFSHKDLMLIYRESPGGPLRAVYFDNEGHVIHYAVTTGKTIQFVSDGKTAGPRYRLTYQPVGPADVTIKFEIAPPGKPDAFATYIEAKARRK